MQTLGDERDAQAAEAENAEAQSLEVDHSLGEINEEIRHAESQIAANRERIAAAESTIEHERSRGADLELEIARCRRQLAGMSAKAGDLQQQLRETTDAIEAAETSQRDVARRLVEAERGLTEVMASLDRLRGENEQRRATYLQQMRTAASLGNETSSLESQAAAAAALRQRCQQRMAELDRDLDALRQEFDELRRRREQATRQVEEEAQSLADAENTLAQFQQRCEAGQKELAEMRERRSGAAERSAVLDELVRRHDGLSAGVKEVLAAGRQSGRRRLSRRSRAGRRPVPRERRSGPLGRNRLGPVGPARRCRAQPRAVRLSPQQTPTNSPAASASSASTKKGSELFFRVVGPWGQKIVLTPFPSILRGSRGCLDGLIDLWKRSPSLHRWPNISSGEHGSSKRSTTRSRWPAAARAQLRHTRRRSARTRRNADRRAAERFDRPNLPPQPIAGAPVAVGRVGDRHRRRAKRSGKARRTDHRPAVASRCIVGRTPPYRRCARRKPRRHHHGRTTAPAVGRAAGLARRRIARRPATTRRRFASACRGREKRKRIDAELAELESNSAALGRQIDGLEGRRLAADRDTTEIKVELAKSEERLRNLRARMRQFEESREERQRGIDEARERLADSTRRAEATRWNILRAEADIADLYLRKETFAAQTTRLVDQRESLQERRTAQNERIQGIRGRIRKIEEKMHAAELAANEVRHERTSMADRLREDYGIELAELEHTATDEEQHQREEVQQEIEELRQKINNLGNVNLEALDELEQLEGRYKSLSDQHADLASAKGSLEKIIERINADSRRLFSETLETVRGHFQTLFRDLFGGGRADVILEENVDILDSGIEIVARPPGKEPRSISLLSGGEKTLTCVALLLAIFRSRPSPFCVLDEVDAALDEANIDRFTKVIQGFLAWTQFIIVTHSKKTMTCANTIYGVTMQESGVTKQVSVRFEDVSDDGHILERPDADGEIQAA